MRSKRSTKRSRLSSPGPSSVPPRTRSRKKAKDTPLHNCLRPILDSSDSDEALTTAETLANIYNIIRAYLVIHPDQFPDLAVNKLATVEQFIHNVKERQSEFVGAFRSAIARGWSNDDLVNLLSLRVFWDVYNQLEVRKNHDTDGTVLVTSMESAVQKSWDDTFVGDRSVTALERHILTQIKSGGFYAQYCSIVQSSGMGKSRLLDQFAKTHFLISVNLRPEGSHGFPPADTDVRAFFSSSDGQRKREESHNYSYRRAFHFINALFRTTATAIEIINPKQNSNTKPNTKQSRYIQKAQVFREHMTDEQNMDSSGPHRSQFYKDVVKMAKESMDKGELADKDLLDAFHRLELKVNGAPPSKATKKMPLVFIMFDEAHSLTKPFHSGTSRNDFVELRRVLSVLNNVSLFTIFLSTTGKFSQFTPPRGQDPSNRMNYGSFKIPLPFIYLGFDQLVSQRVFGDYTTIEQVTSLECIAQMGRPLWASTYKNGNDEVKRALPQFAMQKLLCGTLDPKFNLSMAQKYAILSQRLALDINSVIYTSLSRYQAEMEQEQISNHMRVVVSIGEGVETIRGIAASEPLLSEAAVIIMSDPRFKLADVLSDVLSGFSVNPGDRAELLVSALFTAARDRAALGMQVVAHIPDQLSRCFSVIDLFTSLFCTPIFDSISNVLPSLCRSNTIPQDFKSTFTDTSMHFSHFIKPYEHKTLSRPYLLAFMARGAAALGANCQPGIDAIYPYLYKSKDLHTSHVGFVMVQVKKNDVVRDNEAEIFRKMDPFGCNLLTERDKDEDGQFPIPIIRMVFALAGNERPGVALKTYSSPSEGASFLDTDGQPLFTTYDFWCSGVGEGIFQIAGGSEVRWKALVDKADPWKAFYSAAPDPGLLRTQLPGSGAHKDHYSSWCEVLPE